ncbi:hypothetical protein [Streptomyces sp. NPDC007088]|uniref:SCO4225 family membrane protein n=1 Tax=Streptomyces sp. NPDC007088 TaxID=3364773 RepID=UPI0036AACD5E
MNLPSSRALLTLALVYLAIVFGLDYLSVEQGMDFATVVLSVLTFPSNIVTTVLFLLAAVVVGYDDYDPGPDVYTPSVQAIGGIVQVVVFWLVIRALRKRREKRIRL